MTHTAAAPGTGLHSAVHAWVDGWARARGTDAPQAVPGGFRIEVRRPGHLARHVLPEAEPAVLRDLVDTLTTPGLWIKACAPREVVEPLLTADWEISEPQYLMTTDGLAASHSGAGLPSGYRLQIVDEGEEVFEARVHAVGGPGNGSGAGSGSCSGGAEGPGTVLAASGRAALTTGARGSCPAPYAPSVVFDMIGTQPAHQRRGLGRAVMAALAGRAVERGARQGVLVASPDGRALYEAMGWRLRSPVTAAGRMG
ncbi:GNAT family N-acetyltransferase [Streptomyces nigrescens]|uniref:GNAT family N-acetyltransferase n=1 Tax=Streptomyces nigrescens TaxID=1920 RepID=UPI00346A93C4